MEPVRVNVQRSTADPKLDPQMVLKRELQQARILARLLDSQFEFAGIQFGLDALIGLVPVVGDTIAALAGTYPLYLARKYRLGKSVELKMIANLAIDYVGGLVPFVGDAFDVGFKANLKNLALLERAVAAMKK